MKSRTKLSILFSALLLGFSSSSWLMPEIPEKAAGATVPALTGLATSGQENGSETDSGHITNGLSGSNNSVGFGYSTLGVGYSSTDSNLVLNSVPNFDFGKNNAILAQDTFPLVNRQPAMGNDSVGNTVYTNYRALIVTNQAFKALSWNVGLSVSPLTRVDAPSAQPINAANLLIATDARVVFPNPNFAQGVVQGYFDSYTKQFTLLANSVGDSANGFTINGAQTQDDPTAAPLSIQTNNSSAPYISWTTPSNMADFETYGASTGVNFSGNESAQLQVPYSQQFIGTYQGTLTWTLGTGPGTMT